MKLYYSRFTRAHRPRWVLEELGVPYELQRLDLRQGEHKSPEYLKVHPLGQVPALEDDGLVLLESGAICQYLADKYPEAKLAPAPGTRERGEYYLWCTYLLATVEPELATAFLHLRMLPEAERIPAVAEIAKGKLMKMLRVLEAKVDGREYLVGDQFSVADVLLAAQLSWAKSFGMVDDFPGLQAYMKRHMARPAAQRAYAD